MDKNERDKSSEERKKKKGMTRKERKKLNQVKTGPHKRGGGSKKTE